MKTLRLPINRHFYNEVNNEILVEDYREIKKYWIERLVKTRLKNKTPQQLVDLYFNKNVDIFQNYERVLFSLGYGDNPLTVETKFVSLRLTTPDEMTCMGQGIAFAIKIEYL